MKLDEHQSFQRSIDESLAGDLSTEREQSLREHLEHCALCQEYLSASNRVIAGLGGFSFTEDPALKARVLASLRVRAEQMQATQSSRLRWVSITVAAAVLTTGGSLVDLQCGNVIASVFDLQQTMVRQELVAFWIGPSVFVLAFFPLLLWLSNAGSRRRERAL